MAQPVIESIMPGAGVEGGEVIVTCTDFNFSAYDQACIRFGGAVSRPIGASSNRVIAPVPSNVLDEESEVYITLESDGSMSEGLPFVVGHKLADNLHPVANPAY